MSSGGCISVVCAFATPPHNTTQPPVDTLEHSRPLWLIQARSDAPLSQQAEYTVAREAHRAVDRHRQQERTCCDGHEEARVCVCVCGERVCAQESGVVVVGGGERVKDGGGGGAGECGCGVGEAMSVARTRRERSSRSHRPSSLVTRRPSLVAPHGLMRCVRLAAAQPQQRVSGCVLV